MSPDAPDPNTTPGPALDRKVALFCVGWFCLCLDRVVSRLGGRRPPAREGMSGSGQVRRAEPWDDDIGLVGPLLNTPAIDVNWLKNCWHTDTSRLAKTQERLDMWSSS